jgi:hypothetical protein
MKNQEGIIKIFVITALLILFLKLPAAHYILVIFLKAELIPKTAPIHPNKVAVCIKLNHGPII